MNDAVAAIETLDESSPTHGTVETAALTGIASEDWVVVVVFVGWADDTSPHRSR